MFDKNVPNLCTCNRAPPDEAACVVVAMDTFLVVPSGGHRIDGCDRDSAA